MNIKIEETLNLAIHVLKEELTNIQLINVLGSIVKIVDGEPYVPVLDKLYKNFPAIESNEKALNAISDIVLLISGRHFLIKECLELEAAKDFLEYAIKLTDEIVSMLQVEYKGFIINKKDGGIMLNEKQLSFLNSNFPLLEVSFIGENHTSTDENN